MTPIDIAQFQKADLQAAAVTKANADDFMGGFGSSVTQGAPAGKSRPGTVGTGYHTPLTRGPSRVSMANATRSSTTLTVATNEAVAVPTQNKSALELKEQEIQIKELQYRRERLLSVSLPYQDITMAESNLSFRRQSMTPSKTLIHRFIV